MKLKTIDPKTFITPDRIDIAAKILYAKKKILNDENYLNEERIYLNSIKYINGFVENDNSKKIGKKEFLKRFNKLIYTVYKKGFDKKFPVLINKKTKKLVDGAHRVATAIASNKKKIYVKEVDISNVTINYDSLFGNSMPRNLLEELIYYFCKLEKKTRIIFIWPNLNFEKEKNFLFNTIKKYAEIIYSNKIITTDRGKINLIKYIYNNEKWVHDDRKFDTGPLNKSFSCFKNKNFFHFIIIKKKKIY